MDDALSRAAGSFRTFARPSARKLQAVGMLALLGAIGLSSFAGVTTDRFAADLSITKFLQKADLGSLRGPLFWMGVRGVAGAILAVTATVLWFRGKRVEGVMVALLVVPDLSSFFLRDIIDRARPPDGLVTVYGGPQGPSFPSGTALHWALFGVFMIFLLPKVVETRKIAYGLSALIVLWIAVMGVWVVHHGRHWPSDVLGGYLYGLLYALVFIKLYPLAKAWEARCPELLTMATVRRLGVLVGLVRAK